MDQAETKIHAAFSEDQVERLTGISIRDSSDIGIERTFSNPGSPKKTGV